MKTLEENAYGLLLTLDGFGSTAVRCSDSKLLLSVLWELPSKIGMRFLSKPYVVRVNEKGIRGLSGFIFIMESHISIHTYEEKGFITADIYSCKDFDPNKAANFLIKKYGLKSTETNLVIRGRKFHSSTQE
jgi:S-adenosylmethionine decarboxylase